MDAPEAGNARCGGFDNPLMERCAASVLPGVALVAVSNDENGRPKCLFSRYATSVLNDEKYPNFGGASVRPGRGSPCG